MPIGIVSAVYGARCEVMDNGKTLSCVLRGRLKREASQLAVGDQIEYRLLPNDSGVVERILERRNYLARSHRERPRRRHGAGSYPVQIVLANPDQVVLVVAAREPGIDFTLLDRALALARAANVPAAICVNKMDLADEAEMRRLMEPYVRLGLPVFYVSAAEEWGLDALREHLRGKLSFFWGTSGIGKSSLIRRLTGLEVKVGEWRNDNPRGPHTTNFTKLYPLPFGGLLADTPGFDWLSLDTIEDTEHPARVLLPEAEAFAHECRYPDCSHTGEPDCAVLSKVLSNEIDRGRYARFRAAMAETKPPQRAPQQLLLAGDYLFVQTTDTFGTTWSAFQMHYLFHPEGSELSALRDRLHLPQDEETRHWVLFYEKPNTPENSYRMLDVKVTGTEPITDLLRPGQELILREHGMVIGVVRVAELQPVEDDWQLRKRLKGSPLYESHAFWSDLKPPAKAGSGAGPAAQELPKIYAALMTLELTSRFDAIPSVALGAITAQEEGLVLDCLEIMSSEDEAMRV